MVKNVDDSRIDDLIILVTAFVGQLASRMAELAVTQDARVRSAMWSEIQKILVDLQQAIDRWLADSFRGMFDSVRDSFLGELPSGLAADDLPSDISLSASAAVQRFRQDAGDAITAITAQASRLVRGEAATVLREDEGRLRAALLAGAAGAAVVASVRALVAERLREGMLELLGANGKMYRYDLGYYLSLAATGMKGALQSGLVLGASRALGLDLVQVSSQPSTIGDYCDLYRGKVFSVSGTHPIFPPLSVAPSKGTPFHPWCHHTMSLFDDSRMTAQQKRELAAIPKEFLDLGRRGSGPSAFQSAWLRSRKAKVA